MKKNYSLTSKKFVEILMEFSWNYDKNLLNFALILRIFEKNSKNVQTNWFYNIRNIKGKFVENLGKLKKNK